MLRIILVLSIFSTLAFGNKYLSTPLKEKFDNSEIVLTAKVLSVTCVDKETSAVFEMERCKNSYIRAAIKYRIRVDDILKGESTFLKEHQLRQKIFFNVSALSHGKSTPTIGENYIFLFNSRNLEPSIYEGRNFLEISKEALQLKN